MPKSNSQRPTPNAQNANIQVPTSNAQRQFQRPTPNSQYDFKAGTCPGLGNWGLELRRPEFGSWELRIGSWELGVYSGRLEKSSHEEGAGRQRYPSRGAGSDVFQAVPLPGEPDHRHHD